MRPVTASDATLCEPDPDVDSVCTRLLGDDCWNCWVGEVYACCAVEIARLQRGAELVEQLTDLTASAAMMMVVTAMPESGPARIDFRNPAGSS